MQEKKPFPEQKPGQGLPETGKQGAQTDVGKKGGVPDDHGPIVDAPPRDDRPGVKKGPLKQPTI